MPELSPRRLEFLAVLGLAPPVSEEDVKQAYWEKVKTAHPDRGGDPAAFRRLQDAFEQASQYAQFQANRRAWLAQWVEQYARQQRFVEEVQALGGTADVERADWVTQSIGPDFGTLLDAIGGLRLEGERVTDEALGRLLSETRLLGGLKSMALVNTRVTDLGLGLLRPLANLRSVDLTGTKVSAEAVTKLISELPQLETLVLTDTGIDWWSRKKLGFGQQVRIVG